jgi:hypothetical protein
VHRNAVDGEVHRVFPSFHKRLAPGVWGNLRGCIRLFDAIAPGALGAWRFSGGLARRFTRHFAQLPPRRSATLHVWMLPLNIVP